MKHRLLIFKQEETMKTLDFMNIKKEDILDHDELRNVMAGCGGCATGCILCLTPGGYGCWYRRDYSDPTAVCNSIYPKYDGSGVSGTATVCTSDCHMH
jgi:hypothetical protein